MYIMGSILIILVSLSAIMSFIFHRRHLLMCLLSLEGILLSLMFMYLLITCNMDLFILFIMLSFAACEASLGLACLVMMVRSYGCDMFMMLSGYKC